MDLEQGDVEHQDCVFIFGDQKLSANRLVLSCSSPVFKLMFYGPMASNEIQITDITIDDFQQMLDYIHTRDISLKSVANAWDLYYISQKYFLKVLEKECLDYISCNLTISTLLLCYEYAQLYDLKELANKCWREILLSAKEVLAVDYHMKASTFCDLLDENSLDVDEENLIEIAIKWAKIECTTKYFDTASTSKILIEAGIFQRLRFACLGSKSFHYIHLLEPHNSAELLPLINQCSEKRCKISNILLRLRFRFRKTYKIECNISLPTRIDFSCKVVPSQTIVVYGVAIAQPHQGGLVKACSVAEITVCDFAQNVLAKAEHNIVTLGDYEMPVLVNFVSAIQFESGIPYRISVRYHSSSRKPPNSILCYYLSDCIKGYGNVLKLQFDDETCGGIVRGISYYAM